MFTQKVILDFDKKVEDLFARRNGNELSFDTFFNSLNLYLIKHYTDGKKLTIEFEIEGEADIKVIHSQEHKDDILYEGKISRNLVEIDLTNLDEKGLIFPVFSGNFSLKSLSYKVDAPERKISTAVIFTTFNRQEFLFPNLRKLCTCEHVDKVIVIDNAKNVVLPDDLVATNKIVLIPNGNLGGSGGFTRGMLNAKKLGVSHMFIMDDDITLLPEVVDKALSLISCLKEERKDDWLGFSMLPHSKPTVQFELGTWWNGMRMIINNNELDVSKKENLFKNQVNTKYNYSAWWSLIMPVTVIDKYNYPFPFFIKFDDIEYGLRRKDEDIILTNGFAVWHEDFNKKYNPYLEYYLYRNSLIANSLHDKKPLLHSVIRFLGKNTKYYFKFHHIEMKLMNMAVNDFFAGTDYFVGLDIEGKNNEVRAIAKQKPNVLAGLFVYPLKTIFYTFKLLFGFNKAKCEFRQNIGRLTSESYWEGVFNNVK